MRPDALPITARKSPSGYFVNSCDLMFSNIVRVPSPKPLGLQEPVMVNNCDFLRNMQMALMVSGGSSGESLETGSVK